ncbi:IclR family transcriptional regulator C-terminal domain-containing protein [Pseudomonas sp. SWI44]|uniref:IclR family transcriptional regulator domain-containing protein n=1 Tax=Pseudomonas sp. SWI44 TaxID=2083053 RepID=UPI000CE5E4C9|nr:hypothetical protein C4Q26_14335 [Pseudomonas sp. SWI44]
MLAELPGDLLDHRLEKRTGNTISQKERLPPELAIIRERGYAIDAQGHAEGVTELGLSCGQASATTMRRRSRSPVAFRSRGRPDH